MSGQPPESSASSTRQPRPAWMGWLAKALRFVVVTALFGWLYAWASPKCYPKDHPVGVPLGFVHGALMPMALPSLVMGQDVDIYATANTGRGYKIAYICGINACGLVFFGFLFLSPKRRAKPTSANSDRSG